MPEYFPLPLITLQLMRIYQAVLSSVQLSYPLPCSPHGGEGVHYGWGVIKLVWDRFNTALLGD